MTRSLTAAEYGDQLNRQMSEKRLQDKCEAALRGLGALVKRLRFAGSLGIIQLSESPVAVLPTPTGSTACVGGEQRMQNIPRTPEEYRRRWAESTDVPYGLCWCGCGRATSIAGKTQTRRKIFAGEPHRFVAGHHDRVSPRPLVARFKGKYEVAASGCWLWNGFVDKAGYGRIRSDGGRSGESLYAHRASYELHVGSIPSELELDHLCRNRRCVNPEHLEAVTHQENVRRGERKNDRQAAT